MSAARALTRALLHIGAWLLAFALIATASLLGSLTATLLVAWTLRWPTPVALLAGPVAGVVAGQLAVRALRAGTGRIRRMRHFRLSRRLRRHRRYRSPRPQSSYLGSNGRIGRIYVTCQSKRPSRLTKLVGLLCRPRHNHERTSRRDPQSPQRGRRTALRPLPVTTTPHRPHARRSGGLDG